MFALPKKSSFLIVFLLIRVGSPVLVTLLLPNHALNGGTSDFVDSGVLVSEHHLPYHMHTVHDNLSSFWSVHITLCPTYQVLLQYSKITVFRSIYVIRSILSQSAFNFLSHSMCRFV